MCVTKAEIAKAVHERVGLSKKESAEIVDTVLNTVRNSLEQGEDVKISGFGHFMVRAKRARRGRNPKTGEEITITPRKVVTFRASHLMKMKMGGGDE
jgi:integration host factor subunit alpha